jgi:hypothetical protein
MGFLPPNAARILSATGSASANCPFRWQGPLHGCTTCPLPEGSSLSSSALLSRAVASADWPPRGDGRGPGDRRWGCTHAIRSCPSHQYQDGQGLLNGDNHQEGRRRVHLSSPCLAPGVSGLRFDCAAPKFDSLEVGRSPATWLLHAQSSKTCPEQDTIEAKSAHKPRIDRSPSRFVKAKRKRHINQMALRAEGGPLPTEASDPPLSVISCQYA